MSRKALIVDDEEDLRELLRMQLEEDGFECLEASNINNAFKAFQENKIELLISDINMPNGSGFDLVEKIRKLNQELPIVLLLTDPNPEDKKRAEHLNINLILSKPFQLEEMSEQIKGIL
jgi:two-component system phosphate regulon response regulator PhoB